MKWKISTKHPLTVVRLNDKMFPGRDDTPPAGSSCRLLLDEVGGSAENLQQVNAIDPLLVFHTSWPTKIDNAKYNRLISIANKKSSTSLLQTFSLSNTTDFS